MDGCFNKNDWEDFQSFVNKLDEDTFTAKQASEELRWRKSKALIYTNYISQFNSDEIDSIINYSDKVNLNLLQAIILQAETVRRVLINQLDRIIDAELPLGEIRKVIEENKTLDPKMNIDGKYWKEVSSYLEQLRVDVYPFTKSSRNFLKSISWKKYSTLSAKQINWLDDLIAADKESNESQRYFVNEHLIRQGFDKECKIIESIWDAT
jgi:hypothetical protein